MKDIGGTLNVATVTRATLNAIEKKRFLVIPKVKARLTYFAH